MRSAAARGRARSGRSARILAAIAVAAIAAAGAAALPPGSVGPAEPARPAASLATGSLSQSNSRAGMPIFTAENIGPGDSTTGSVTITNSGTLGGHFRLSPSGLADVPGLSGGGLSERLQLAVHDVTAAEMTANVYSGTLAEMTPRALGLFGPGEARTYRFTATLADGGQPSSPATGDNAFSGSSVRVGFRWDAVEPPTPAPPASRPPLPASPSRAGDRRPPRLRLIIPRVQRVISRGYLTMRARCDETCGLHVSGRVRAGRAPSVPIRQVRRRLARNRSAAVRVRIPRRALPALRRAIVRGDPARVRLNVTARDRSGNKTVARRNVRLRRR